MIKVKDVLLSYKRGGIRAVEKALDSAAVDSSTWVGSIKRMIDRGMAVSAKVEIETVGDNFKIKTKMLNDSISHTVVKDLNIEELVPNVFDGNVIAMYENHHTVALADNMAGEKYAHWLKTRGGIFSTDVLLFTRNKPHGKYVLIEDGNERTVVRLIEEEEEERFLVLKLIDGAIKDKKYMLLKSFQENEKLTSTTKYINNIDDVEIIETSSILLPRENGELEDDHNYAIGSVSLFND